MTMHKGLTPSNLYC